MALIQTINRKALSQQVKEDIEAFTAWKYNDGHRNHLGASVIGHICDRYLWYIFRWVRLPDFSGRMQRIFNRGHLEELRWIEWLRGIGFVVHDATADGKQFRVVGVHGHFGGSLDSVIEPPPRYEVNQPMLGEFKTLNTKQFSLLVEKDSVKLAKPMHYRQMCVYGKNYGFKYALYFGINKNDDDIYVECVELDWSLAAELEHRAEVIITAKLPPPRFSENPAVYDCKFCDLLAVCHSGGAYAKNCRSCHFAIPGEAGTWQCTAFNNQTIPPEVLPVGCAAYREAGRGK